MLDDRLWQVGFMNGKGELRFEAFIEKASLS
jgi:hypothetical protein